MVDSRRDVAGQAGRSPSPSVQATMIGLMAILLWSLMTGLVRVVADAFGAERGDRTGTRSAQRRAGSR